LDWGTRRKPIGAIVAWSSLAIFAVLSILGIAGVVMGLQPRPAATEVVTAERAPEPAPVEERLPDESSFAEATTVAPVAQPEAEAVATSDAMIASTFDQLVEPVLVPVDQVPEGAVAVNPATPVETAVVADAGVELPMSRDAAALAARPATVGRNAAAWAIESEVPDEDRNTTALGYAARPDDTVRVGDSAINVRSGPSQANKKLFALAAGAEVDVTGRSGDWVAITDGKDRDGWVDASLLENVDLTSLPVVEDVPAAEPAAPAKATNLRKVAGSGVTVRSGPGKSNRSLFNLSGGAQVTVLDDSKGWLKIKDADGRTGWAYKSYIKG
jgi:uncharacterized protein YgiM (DUF1202 family)